MAVNDPIPPSIPYEHKAYPTWKYPKDPSLKAVIARDPEHEKALGDGYFSSPVEAAEAAAKDAQAAADAKAAEEKAAADKAAADAKQSKGKKETAPAS